VKGWLDKNGKLHEKVYDVVWSARANPTQTGKLPPSATPWMWRTPAGPRHWRAGS